MEPMPLTSKEKMRTYRQPLTALMKYLGFVSGKTGKPSISAFLTRLAHAQRDGEPVIVMVGDEVYPAPGARKDGEA